MGRLAFFFHFCKALTAINRAVFAGFERYLGFFAAGCACCYEHLACATGSVFAGVTAGFAALGLILEATACIEFLFTGGESKFLTAIFAY